MAKRFRETAWRGDRGEGSIFFFVRQDGTRVSPNLYVSYRAEGKEYVVSAKAADLDEAKRELRRLTRNRENAREGKEPLSTPKTERVTVGDLLDANLRRAEERVARIGDYKHRTEIVRNLLGHVRAVEFRPGHVDAYKVARRKTVGDTSIRHELEILNRAFTYAVERRMLPFAPFVEKPKEDHVRQQELPAEQYPALLDAMGRRCQDSRDFVEFMLLTARRITGSLLLTWDRFNDRTWTLTMPAEKGGNPVVLAIEGRLRSVIESRIQRRSQNIACPYIFQTAGRRLTDKVVRRAYREALEELELPYGRDGGFVLYDTKSTACGLMTDAGLSDREIMEMSGHKTPSMLHRYIKRNADRSRASVLRRDAYLEKRLAEKKNSNAEKVVEFPKQIEG